jgi:hypothetical protein
MTWRESVLRLMPELPARFETRDLYQLVPALRQEYPDNHHIQEKLRQVLQEFREEGLIAFSTEGGLYTKLGALAGHELRWPFERNQSTTRQALADLFQQSSIDALRRGMFRPREGHPWRQHMVIFHDEAENPYGDVVEPGRIVYVGEGANGDQRLVGYNRYLANHLAEGIHVHYFVQPQSRPGIIVYQGEVVLESLRYVRRPGDTRSVYEFILLERVEGNPMQAFGAEIIDMEEDERPPGYEDRRVVLTSQKRLWRDPGFRDLVLKAYSMQCAVCGKTFERSPLIDLQGAHIVGVHEKGRDVVPNGLALCARHHWAFDNGFFSLSDEHRIIWMAPEEDPHGEIKTGELVQLPMRRNDHPHPFYLGHHRTKWHA